MNLTIRQRVKLVCDHANIPQKDVAARIGMSAASFTLRLKTGKFTKEELEQIAEAAGCRYFSAFRFSNGAEYSMPTMLLQIRCALDHVDMSAAELGRKMGLTQQAISKRLHIGKITQDELEVIANYIGCEYISEFRFDDGARY